MAKEAEVKALALELMAKHGLLQDGWTFRMGKGTKSFGRCRIKYNGAGLPLKEISISRPLSSVNTLERCKDTILHEIAHAIAGIRNGHNYVWKRVCLEIGAPPVRCFTSENTVMVEQKNIPKVGKKRKHANSYTYKGQVWKIGDEFYSGPDKLLSSRPLMAFS
jgi:hypothetical protein